MQNTTISTVAEVYQYLDGLFDQDVDSDTLFSGGYLRGVFSLVATDFGDESQTITTILCEAVTNKITQSKVELSPQDFAIVVNFWLETQKKFIV